MVTINLFTRFQKTLYALLFTTIILTVLPTSYANDLAGICTQTFYKVPANTPTCEYDPVSTKCNCYRENFAGKCGIINPTLVKKLTTKLITDSNSVLGLNPYDASGLIINETETEGTLAQSKRIEIDIPFSSDPAQVINLSGAKFIGVNSAKKAANWILGAKLENAAFLNCSNNSTISYREVNMSHSNLKGAEFHGITFKKGNLASATFGTSLESTRTTRFIGSDFTQTNFYYSSGKIEAHSTNFSKSKFGKKNDHTKAANLSGSVFCNYPTFDSAKLNSANLSNSDFQQAVLIVKDADNKGLNIAGSRFGSDYDSDTHSYAVSNLIKNGSSNSSKYSGKDVYSNGLCINEAVELPSTLGANTKANDPVNFMDPENFEIGGCTNVTNQQVVDKCNQVVSYHN